MRGAPGPPRLWRALLSVSGDARRTAEIRDDLEEEFLRHHVPESGLRAARRWYRRQVLRSLPSLLRRRWSRRRVSLPAPVSPMSVLSRDLSFAARALRARPLPTAVAVLTLAMGIGATTAVYSALRAVVLRPLPYAEPDRLVRVRPTELFFATPAAYEYFRERAAGQLEVAAYGRTLATLTGEDEPEVVRGALVSFNHFDLLGAPPLLGRGFLPGDAEPGAEPTLILGHGLWQRRYGGDATVVGTMIPVGGVAHRVIGVMGTDHLPIELDWEIWFPLEEAEEGRHADSAIAFIGRLAPAIGIERASELTRQIFLDRMNERGTTADDETVALLYVEPLERWLIGETAPRVRLLFAAVTLVLLIAAVNVAHLLLAQSGSRRQELSVRAALGASRGRLVRQLLTESLLLGGLGGALGILVASFLVSLVRPLMPAEVPRAAAIGVDAGVLAFAFAATLGATILAGIVPALRDSRAGEAESVRSGSGAGLRRGATRLASALVVAEVSLCVLLVVAAGLTVRSLRTLQAVDVGFRAEQLVAVRPVPLSARYPEAADVAAYHAEVRATLERLPSVRSVAGIMFLPMRPGGWYGGYWTPDAPPVEADPPGTSLRMVTDGYFETMEVPVLSGRTFTAAEIADGEAVIVINRALGDAAFGPGAEAVGRELVVAGASRRVVGVVGDVRQQNVQAAAAPEGYVPHDSSQWRNLYFVARVEGDPDRALEAVIAAVRSVDRQVPLTDPVVVARAVATTFASHTLTAVLFGAFAVLALALGLVGVYGVTSNGVVQRRREIGIRMALGARAAGVQRATILRGMAPVVLGLLMGSGAAAVATRWLSSLLFEVSPGDPLTFLSVPLIVLLTAAAALWIPARRAASVDPQVVLREG